MVVPPVIPVTTPALLMLATPGALLLQVPPGTASLKLVVAPVHTDGTPDIAAGAMVTVTTVVAATPQPVA